MKSIALFLLDRSAMRGITLGKPIEKIVGARLGHRRDLARRRRGSGRAPAGRRDGRRREDRHDPVRDPHHDRGALRRRWPAPPTRPRSATRGSARAFGKPIVEHQAIGFKLADMLTSIHAAIVMTYQAAARLDAGRRSGARRRWPSSSPPRRRCASPTRPRAIFASYGLATEYPVQRYFRDARFLLPGAERRRSCGRDRARARLGSGRAFALNIEIRDAEAEVNGVRRTSRRRCQVPGDVRPRLPGVLVRVAPPRSSSAAITWPSRPTCAGTTSVPPTIGRVRRPEARRGHPRRWPSTWGTGDSRWWLTTGWGGAWVFAMLLPACSSAWC